MSLVLFLLAAAIGEVPAMQSSGSDSLSAERPVSTRAAVHPRLFLAEHFEDGAGSEPLFDLPSWLYELIDKGPIPDLPDLEIRMTARRLCLGYTFRF